MIKAVQYTDDLRVENIINAGFKDAEIVYDEDVAKESSKDFCISKNINILSVRMKADDLAADDCSGRLEGLTGKYSFSFLTIETVNSKITLPELYDFFLQKEMMETISRLQLKVCIEIGLDIGADKCIRNSYSDTNRLMDMTVRLNDKYSRKSHGADVAKNNCKEHGIKRAKCDSNHDYFGIAFNTGLANLLKLNIAGRIGELGDKLWLLYVNDNDGFHDLKQMPYTFIAGRGALTTDWRKIVISLIETGFDGPIIFDTKGLFETIPVGIQEANLKLLYDIASSWENNISFEKKLADAAETGKEIILFGAGIRTEIFMKLFGERYTPSFIADNNAKRWGEEFCGISIQSPSHILDLNKDKRLVIICNMYFYEIGKQLDGMGVEHILFEDAYFPQAEAEAIA